MDILNRITARLARVELERAGELLDRAGVPKVQLGRLRSLEERISLLMSFARCGWPLPPTTGLGEALAVLHQAEEAHKRGNKAAAVLLYEEAGTRLCEAVLTGAVPASKMDIMILDALTACRKGRVPAQGIILFLRCLRRGVSLSEDAHAEFRLCKQELRFRIEDGSRMNKETRNILSKLDPEEVRFATGLSMSELSTLKDLRWDQVSLILENL